LTSGSSPCALALLPWTHHACALCSSLGLITVPVLCAPRLASTRGSSTAPLPVHATAHASLPTRKPRASIAPLPPHHVPPSHPHGRRPGSTPSRWTTSTPCPRSRPSASASARLTTSWRASEGSGAGEG